MSMSNEATFELNGEKYATDLETLSVLRTIMPAARATKDGSAVQAMIFAGEASGRIRKIEVTR